MTASAELDAAVESHDMDLPEGSQEAVLAPEAEREALHAVLAQEPVSSQIDVLRRRLCEEDELEKPEFFAALLSTVVLVVTGGLLSFLAFSKVWWVSLLFTVGSGAGALLLWFGISIIVANRGRGFGLSWWLSSFGTGAATWWLFASWWAGLLTGGIGIASFLLFDRLFRKRQRQNWESLGLPVALCQHIISLPETLPVEVSSLLDEIFLDYNELGEALHEGQLAVTPAQLKKLRKDADAVVCNLLQRTPQLIKLKLLAGDGKSPKTEALLEQELQQMATVVVTFQEAAAVISDAALNEESSEEDLIIQLTNLQLLAQGHTPQLP